MKGKGIICFLLGAAVGGVTGYIIGTRRQIKKNDTEIEELEAYYKKKYEGAVTRSDILRQQAQKEKKPVEKTTEQASEAALKLQEEKFKTFDRITPVKAPIEDYAAKYKTVITREEDDGPELSGGPHDLDSEEEKAEMAQYKTMIIISPDEWDQEDVYEKNEITYFEPDEFFADKFGVRIPFEVLSPDDVGRGNLEQFGISGEDGVLYVRDEENMEDFKIYLEETAYEGPLD